LDSIVRTGKFDIIHAHGHHYPITWRAIASAAKYDIPSVLTLHGMYALNPAVFGGKTKLETLFNKYIFTRILSKATSVIGLTKQITEYARQYGGGSTTYYTIANGVDTTAYIENLKRKKEYRKKYDISEDNIVILFSGRFEHVKGILEFANAVKSIVKDVPKLRIVIVGEGTLESRVKSILGGLDQTQVLSWRPSEEIHELYIASDIFVIPSRFEALPIAIIEAMNAGLHIVYTPVGGIPDILEKYASRTMIRNSSVEEIENALTQLIYTFPVDANITESLNYARNFDWKNIVFEVEKLYSKIGRSA
jgi:glycosyltransferase involved in cell wall biosynthesis